MIRITKTPIEFAHEWSAVDRSFVVESELKLRLVDGRLGHDLVTVPRYEKTYASERSTGADTELFVACVQDRPAGEIRLSPNWNGYAYIDNLVVSQAFRRLGIGTALVKHAIEWSRSRHLPGVMLETQSNNVPACKLYERCGFRLSGFDSDLYRGLNPSHREVALFWYWRAEPHTGR